MIVVAGQVLLDNVDIKTLQLKWLRDQIGLVNQEPALFATTILENILYGKPDATMAEVEAAATSANAHSFIALLPNGYNTHVGSTSTFILIICLLLPCNTIILFKNTSLLLWNLLCSFLLKLQLFFQLVVLFSSYLWTFYYWKVIQTS
jgi:hypothetical protein